MDINFGLLATYVVSLLIMIGFPIALVFFATSRLKVSWWAILAGVLTFIGSQALRIPASSGLNLLFQNGTLPAPSAAMIPFLNALIAGLMAGIFEETARYVGFLLLKKKAKTVRSGLGLGLGHGGTESILLGVLGTGVTLFTVLFYNAGGQIAKGVSADQVQYMMAQISQFWTTPWHFGLLPGVERAIAISVQIVLSLLVWKAVVDRKVLWFVLALVYHIVIDAVAVYVTQIGWSYWAVEGLLAVFLVLNVYLIYRFWKDETAIEADEEYVEDDDDEDEDEDDEDEEEEETDEENDVDQVDEDDEAEEVVKK
jgi:uncharacterized membrane protein YhfC